jgi:3-hydroxyacyl-CoA dehydrogenase/enoyl-CoA hydratase/3-hydroxybutyryl-CoA epimerase
VLATNTSSIRVRDISTGVPHPERVVGLHFFNPPQQMPLVEVVRTEKSSPGAVAAAFALAQRLGKTAVVVQDCAGFLVNRLLAPYMNEAGYLLLEIDRVAVAFGLPMGPLELTDLVGLEVARHVAESMHAAYGERMAPAPLWTALKELSNQPQKGRASFGTPSRDEVTQRLIFPMINEAARCLDEGIVSRADEIDLAMVFGTGFAPFRGGPLRYAETLGLSTIVNVLEQLAATRPRLAPSDSLRRMASGQAINA